VGLLVEILGEQPERGKRFPWALGDVSAKTGRALQLPFDAVWESRRLIVEVDEDQHRKPAPFFDHPERTTVSGVTRSEQRPLYDERKRSAARREGYRVLVVPWDESRKVRRRDRDADLERYRQLIEREGLLRGR